MRLWLVVLVGGVIASAQSITEAAAATAGGTVGGAAGRKVSDGITAIFDKVDQKTGKAAEGGSKGSAGMLQVGPGVPKAVATSPAATPLPPPPPARKPGPQRAALQKPAPAPPPVEAVPPIAPPVEDIAPPPPPAPEITPADLQNLERGASREDVLKLGIPVARITMFEDGHLLEIFRYASGDYTFGLVRLTDGALSAIQLR